MKKIFSIISVFLLLFVLSACGKEKARTYKADGVYVAWDLEVHEDDLYLLDGTKYLDADGNGLKVNTPALCMVKVEVRGDEIVDYYIDEIQGKALATLDEEGKIAQVAFNFNTQTKKELGYDYKMAQIMKVREWFIQATILENNWLENGKVEAVSSMTITMDNYVSIAQRAVNNAKEGKVAAVYPVNEGSYGATAYFVTADINAEGKISNVKLDANLFNYLDKATDHKYNWDSKTKYAGYPAMLQGALWQDSIDTLTNYINENGWDGTLYTKNAGKDLADNNGIVDALSSVSVTVQYEVLVMNQLWKYFPRGWK